MTESTVICTCGHPRPEHEREMLAVIDQRDEAEDALNHAYAAVVGTSPEWSNCFGYSDAINEIVEIHRAEKEKRLAAESKLESLRLSHAALMTMLGDAVEWLRYSTSEEYQVALLQNRFVDSACVALADARKLVQP